MKNAKAVGISVAVFVAMVFLSSMIILSSARNSHDDEMEKARYLLEAEASNLDSALSSYIQATDTLRILVVDGKGEINDFDAVAKEIYNDDPAFRSIQLAPGGTVQYVYPLEGNEEAFGNLFEDPDRRTEAEYARDSGETTLAGPFQLYQAGMGIVVRQPIYLEQDGAQTFWGFSIAVLNVPEIFNAVHLDALAGMGYHYQLWRIHPDTGEKQIILGNADKISSDAIERGFDVPGSTWTLSMSRDGGWVSADRIMPVVVGVACATLLTTLLCYALIVINEQRRRLAEMANRDYLTGLYNARKLSSILQSLMADGKPFYFAYLDVNDFKAVNDEHGHASGDALLKEIASRLTAASRPDDYTFRIGGDEFALVIPSAEGAQQHIETLLGSLSGEMTFEDGTCYHPRLSMGCAFYPKDASSIEKIMSIADDRMYHMKRDDHTEHTR